jgi:hypothetical protein
VGVKRRNRRNTPIRRFFAVSRLAWAVEAEFDDPGGDLAGAVAAGVAGDVELGGEGVEAALGGALGDVQLGGDLGAGGGTTGEGTLAAVGATRAAAVARSSSLRATAGSLAATVAPTGVTDPVFTSSRYPPTIRVSPSRRRRGLSSGSPFSAVPLRLSRSVAIKTSPRRSISR